MSSWVYTIIEMFPDKIEDIKFAREWNEMLFAEVKSFYYKMFVFYMIFVFALNYLLMGIKSEEALEWTW